MTPRWQWAVIAYLLLWAFCCAGCAYKLRTTDTANRTEETRNVWQTAETAASQTQSVATEKKQGNRQTRRWTPDGKLMEEVIEHWGSDGRVQVASESSSHAASTGHASQSAKASSSSSTKADTQAGWSPWWWALLLAPAAAGAWALRKWIRARIPFL